VGAGAAVARFSRLSPGTAARSLVLAGVLPGLSTLVQPVSVGVGGGPLGGGMQVRGMRHGRRKGTLNRPYKKRKRMLRQLVTHLVTHERIVTTLTRAKTLKRWADWVVTMGKGGTLGDRRRAQAILYTDESLLKVFSVLAHRYKDRNGGYTRVLRMVKNRRGDNAPMAAIEYVDRPGELRDANPPAHQLPYSKMIVRAQEEGDDDLMEYYRQKQTEVVAGQQRRLRHKAKHLLRPGQRQSSWWDGMKEYPHPLRELHDEIHGNTPAAAPEDAPDAQAAPAQQQ